MNMHVIGVLHQTFRIKTGLHVTMRIILANSPIHILMLQEFFFPDASPILMLQEFPLINAIPILMLQTIPLINAIPILMRQEFPLINAVRYIIYCPIWFWVITKHILNNVFGLLRNAKQHIV